MTTNKHWLYLEALRKSGVTNMWGAALYIYKKNLEFPMKKPKGF